MPSFQDSAVIFFIALLLFGPKKLPELARYVGKLMGEFRRASNEFRNQMEDEFRQAEQAEQQKKIAALEAAAPLAPIQDIPEPEHPHLPPPEPTFLTSSDLTPETIPDTFPEHHIDPRPTTTQPAESLLIASAEPVDSAPPHDPTPIASNGNLHLMPPATGLPVGRSQASTSLSGVFDSVPHAPEPKAKPEPVQEAHANG